MRAWTAAVAALALLTTACGGEDGGGVAGGSTATGGQGGQGAAGGQGGGAQAGAQLLCPPGELDDGAGGCVPPGVPADGCGQGFDSDGEGGCVAILPDAPCAAGLMALPGEDSCRPVVPCGAGTWGDIPVDGTTVFVDQSYGGGNSDGSQSQPWTTVQAALAAAPADARVAIAAGDYQEDLVLSTPMVLWGKCPAEVALGGSGSNSAIVVSSSGSGSEIRGLAVSGNGAGIDVISAHVLIDSVWIHDTSDNGVYVSGSGGVGSATVQRSLIERASQVAIGGWSADLIVEDSVVRDTQPTSAGTFGRGIELAAISGAASLIVRRSVAARNHDSAIFVVGAPALIEDTLVTDTQPAQSNLVRGAGIEGFRDSGSGRRAELTVSGTVVEGSHYCGVCLEDSELSMERTVVRDTSPQVADNLFGFGVRIFGVQQGLPERPYGDIRASTIDGAYLVALPVVGAEATIENTIVRNIEPRASDLLFGRAISLETSNLTGLGSTGTIRGVLAERGHEVAIHVLASEADIEAAWVRDMEPRAADETFGAGIAFTLDIFSQITASGTVSQTVIEDVHAAAFAVGGANVTASDLLVQRALPQPGGDFGDGIIVSSYLVLIPGVFPSSLELERVTVSDSARAGIASFGADIAVASSVLDCNFIQLDGESVEGATFHFDDRGGNRCGCAGAEEDCKVLSSGLEPPLPPIF